MVALGRRRGSCSPPRRPSHDHPAEASRAMRRELAHAGLSSCALCADAAWRRSGPGLAHQRERSWMYDQARLFASFGKAISRPRPTHGCAGSACLKRIGDRATDGQGSAVPAASWRVLVLNSSPELSPYPWDVLLCTLCLIAAAAWAYTQVGECLLHARLCASTPATHGR